VAEWHGRQPLAIAHAASLDERLREPLCQHSCHLVAEAVEAVAHESAVTLDDILLRRVPVTLGACWQRECSREAAQKIGRALGWDQARLHMELLRCEEERAIFLHPGQPRDAKPGCLSSESQIRTEQA
jgi:glycerol-3-phosphate dehydrogenase